MSEETATIIRRGYAHITPLGRARNLHKCRVVNDQNGPTLAASLERRANVRLQDCLGTETVVVDEAIKPFELRVRAHGSWKASPRIQCDGCSHLQQSRIASLVSQSRAIK